MGEPARFQSCPECGGRIRSDSGERSCEECGLVVETERIDRGPEWRSFDDESDDRRRTGAPLTRSRHDRGLSTEIGFEPAGRITGRKRRQLARLRREHNRAQISTKAERNRVAGFSQIWGLVDRLSLPLDARDEACRLFEVAQKEGLLRGRSIEGFAAATVYAVSRTLSVPRSIEEVTEQASASPDELKAAYRALNRELDLSTGPIDPASYLPRFTSELDLDHEVERTAGEYLDELREENAVVGRNPCGIAAACLYVAAKDHATPITQAEAAEVADVSPVTIRKTAHRLERDE